MGSQPRVILRRIRRSIRLPPGAAGTGHEGFGHLHAVATDPDSGALYVATHVGLFRLDDPHTAVRVSKAALDLMCFTVVGPGHFLAPGHAEDGPANVDLIESTDGGVAWQAKSLHPPRAPKPVNVLSISYMPIAGFRRVT